jgi:very-short-patch-repair endonuclease
MENHMTKNDLIRVISNTYNRNNWITLLHSVFAKVTIFSQPLKIPVQNEEINEFYHMGNIRLNDGNSLAVFELHVSDKVKLKRNKVALHTIISKYIDQERHHGVIALFDSSSDDYRLTFTAKSTTLTETGFNTTTTDSKRYTYVLGPNETYRTPVERFEMLASKGDSLTLQDVEDAFSVDRLNKQFFNKYKEHYEQFVCHLTGKHFIKKQGKWVEEKVTTPSTYMQTVFSNSDKKARDFIKKSLGRFVFLYFLQKKGWLGCSVHRNDWKDGDRAFMKHYFDTCPDKEHFHSKYLIPLYYEGMNKKRPNDLFELTNSRIPYLNGGLFEPDNIGEETIDFPVSYWQSLYHFFDEYNFTIDENDPFEREVGIDPEMLGNIFENLLEDNKDKGAFYTPKPIVEYMCKESLLQYLKTHLFLKQDEDTSSHSPLAEGCGVSRGVFSSPLAEGCGVSRGVFIPLLQRGGIRPLTNDGVFSPLQSSSASAGGCSHSPLQRGAASGAGCSHSPLQRGAASAAGCSTPATSEEIHTVTDENSHHSIPEHGIYRQFQELPYNPKLKERAKELRKAGNLSEVLFWNQVKNHQFLNLDFHRQKIIGNYIVDFYCPELQLVVEIDGSSHDDKLEYDAERDAYIQGLGLKILHYDDAAVKQNLNAVMDDLKEICGELENTPSLRDTPLQEGNNSWSLPGSSLQERNENTPVDKSTTPLQEGNENMEALENFIRNHQAGDPDDSHNFIRNNAAAIEALLDTVKICDPAIGSGAFPMGLLKEIFWAKMTLDLALNPAETKKKIIENSIYGVDIDSGAIDIARLRFWLSLIVDAEEPEPLPNLDYKIMQGNSLLESFEGISLYEKDKTNEIQSLVNTIEHLKTTEKELQSITAQYYAKNRWWLPENRRKVKTLPDRSGQEVLLFVNVNDQPVGGNDVPEELIKAEEELKAIQKKLRDTKERLRRLKDAKPDNQVFTDTAHLMHEYYQTSNPERKKHIHQKLDKYVLTYIESKLDQHTQSLQITADGLKNELTKKAKSLKNTKQIEQLWNSKQAKQLAALEAEMQSMIAKYNKLSELQNSSDRPFFLWHLYFSEVFMDSIDARREGTPRHSSKAECHPSARGEENTPSLLPQSHPSARGTDNTPSLLTQSHPSARGEENTPSLLPQSHPSARGEWRAGGFDIVIGNPPYIQLQNDGGHLASIYQEAGFQSFAKTGDIYCLFYEKGFDLLTPGGHLCYITSNKWMRAGYGKKLRSFFATKTNPKRLIDFGGYKVFENATVDSNILLSAKEPMKHTLVAVTIGDDFIKGTNIADYLHQNGVILQECTDASWIISSPLELSIKKKIEQLGTPLKEWDVNINYGIKTGYNEAFIIDGAKKDELIAADPRSAEIIKPILRGRDIKRYKAEFADLWLIATHNGYKTHSPLQSGGSVADGVSIPLLQRGGSVADGVFDDHNSQEPTHIPRIDVNDYPAIKAHLDQYYDRLEKRYDKGDTPYNLRNCAYIDEFEKEKIVYNDINQKLTFSLALPGVFYNNTVYSVSHCELNYYLLGILNARLIDWYYRWISAQLGKKAVRMFSIYFEKMPIIISSVETQNLFNTLVSELLKIKNQTDDTNTPAPYNNTLQEEETPRLCSRRATPLRRGQTSTLQEEETPRLCSRRATPLQEGNGSASDIENILDLMVYKLYELSYAEVLVIDPAFDAVLEQFGLAQADYERMSVEELAGLYE